jgi:hypothetical protein
MKSAPPENSTTARDTGDRPAHRDRNRPRRRALGLLTLGLAALLALTGVLWEIPATRTILQQSFTQLPSRYTELYFTSTPTFDGTTVVVPVTVVDHGTQPSTRSVRVQLESANGIILTDSTVRLLLRDNDPGSAIVRIAAPPGTEVVLVTLPGGPQSLHYRLVN